MRENNIFIERVREDDPCGGLPGAFTLLRTCRDNGLPTEYEVFATNYHQRVSHIQNWVLPRLPRALNPEVNADLRLSYLLGNMTAEELKIKVQQRDKKQLKDIAHRQVMDTFVAGATDLIIAFVANGKKQKWVTHKKEIYEQLECMQNLVLFCEKSFARLSEKYHCVKRTIGGPNLPPL